MIIHFSFSFSEIKDYPQLKFVAYKKHHWPFPLLNHLKQNTNYRSKPRFCLVLFYKGQNVATETLELESCFRLFNTVLNFKLYVHTLIEPSTIKSLKILTIRNSLVDQWLGLGPSTAVAWVPTLVGKLRSRKPCGGAKSKKRKENTILTMEHAFFLQ